MEEEVKALAAMAATQRAADKNFEESQREQASSSTCPRRPCNGAGSRRPDLVLRDNPSVASVH